MQKSPSTHTHRIVQHAWWNSWQLCRVTFWDSAGDTACGWRVFRAYPLPSLPLSPPLATLWQPLMALAHFWLLAAQHFVFQINLVSSTVLLCSGPSECPCLGQDMIMLDIAASRRAELALRFSCALVQCPCRQCAASIQLKEEPECKLDAECR